MMDALHVVQKTLEILRWITLTEILHGRINVIIVKNSGMGLQHSLTGVILDIVNY